MGCLMSYCTKLDLSVTQSCFNFCVCKTSVFQMSAIAEFGFVLLLMFMFT